MPTPTEQKRIARYGTADETEILKLKGETTQKRDFVVQKAMTLNLSAEDCTKLCKAAGIEYLPGYEERVVQYTMSDETIDRAGDIMMMDGANLDQFKKNAVVLRMHDARDFPVGYCLKVWVDKTQLKGQVLFLDDRVDTSGMSDRAFRYVKSNVMKGCSIGFKVDELKFPSMDERRALGMKDYGVVFIKWTLCELSICPVPMNAGALAEAVKKGMLFAEDVEMLGEKVETPTITKSQDMDSETIVEKLLEEFMPQILTKAGKEISKKNREKLQAIHDKMDDANKTHRGVMRDCMKDLHDMAYAEEDPADGDGNPSDNNGDADDEGKAQTHGSTKATMDLESINNSKLRLQKLSVGS